MPAFWWRCAHLILPKIPPHRRRFFSSADSPVAPLIRSHRPEFWGGPGVLGLLGVLSGVGGVEAALLAFSAGRGGLARRGDAHYPFLVVLIETALNLQYHDFDTPNRIIWLQIPGLSAEHLAMIRFQSVNSTTPLSLEKFLCQAKCGVTIFIVCGPPHEGMLCQIYGSKNIQNGAHPVDRRPFWDYLRTTEQQKFKVGIFEKGVKPEESLSSVALPKDQDLYFWLMSKAPKEQVGINYFHQMNTNYQKPGRYYDQSCHQQAECFSSQYNNFLAIFERFSKNEDYYVFILRNFDYYQKLQAKQLQLAREELANIIVH